MHLNPSIFITLTSYWRRARSCQRSLSPKKMTPCLSLPFTLFQKRKHLKHTSRSRRDVFWFLWVFY